MLVLQIFLPNKFILLTFSELLSHLVPTLNSLLKIKSKPVFPIKWLIFQTGLSSSNDEDSCQAIVGLKFVNGDDCDTILVRIFFFLVHQLGSELGAV